jgi:hypothetical protein
MLHLIQLNFWCGFTWKITRRWEDNIKMDLREIGCEDGSGWNWFRIVPSGGFRYKRC